ncbi:MAG: LysE family translocator [Thermomicrobiales bacterium]
MDHRLLAFLGIAAILIITPGVDMALVTKNALRHGRNTAIVTAFGVNAGLLVWTIAAALGVAGILRASATAFTVLKLLGAGYLIFLGLQALWLSFHGSSEAERDSRATRVAHAPLPPLSAQRAFRQGLLSNLFNPKIAIFFTSFLPQFIAPTDSVLGKSLLLGVLFTAMTVAWLTGYATFASKAGDLLCRPRIKAAMDRLTACVLIAFGLRLATEHR